MIIIKIFTRMIMIDMMTVKVIDWLIDENSNDDNINDNDNDDKKIYELD